MENFNSPDPIAEIEGLEAWDATNFDEDGNPVEPSEIDDDSDLD